MMMNKKRIASVACLASLALLGGCASSKPSSMPSADAQLNQLCQNLKQQIIMDEVRNVPEELGSNPAKEAQLYKSYDQYHCDDVLSQAKNTSIVTSRNTRSTSNR